MAAAGDAVMMETATADEAQLSSAAMAGEEDELFMDFTLESRFPGNSKAAQQQTAALQRRKCSPLHVWQRQQGTSVITI